MRIVNQEPVDEDPDTGPINIPQLITADIIINDLWEICDDGWQLTFKSDMWWHLKADCIHGTYTVESKSQSDFTSALIKLYHKVFDGHNNIKDN